MALRPCLGGPDGHPCGALTTASRCPEHRRQIDRARGTPDERGYDWRWRQLVAAKIEAEPWCHRDGGCRYPATAGTPANPLSGDHLVPKSRGGDDSPDNVVVTCRDDNSSKGNR